MTQPAAHRIAVLVPCYNEALTIAAIVRDFKTYLPQATVYVFDNNSTDGTAQIARAAGAVGRNVTAQGKGSVVRRMLVSVALQLVTRLPTAVLCAALMLFGVILLVCCIILDAVTKGRIEQKRFAYLAHPGPAPLPDA
jgi:glycosyltransferase involved in cell wall biosynthesis